MQERMTRREFLKLGATGLGGVCLKLSGLDKMFDQNLNGDNPCQNPSKPIKEFADYWDRMTVEMRPGFSFNGSELVRRMAIESGISLSEYEFDVIAITLGATEVDGNGNYVSPRYAKKFWGEEDRTRGPIITFKLNARGEVETGHDGITFNRFSLLINIDDLASCQGSSGQVKAGLREVREVPTPVTSEPIPVEPAELPQAEQPVNFIEKSEVKSGVSFIPTEAQTPEIPNDPHLQANTDKVLAISAGILAICVGINFVFRRKKRNPSPTFVTFTPGFHKTYLEGKDHKGGKIVSVLERDKLSSGHTPSGVDLSSTPHLFRDNTEETTRFLENLDTRNDLIKGNVDGNLTYARRTDFPAKRHLGRDLPRTTVEPGYRSIPISQNSGGSNYSFLKNDGPKTDYAWYTADSPTVDEIRGESFSTKVKNFFRLLRDATVEGSTSINELVKASAQASADLGANAEEVMNAAKEAVNIVARTEREASFAIFLEKEIV